MKRNYINWHNYLLFNNLRDSPYASNTYKNILEIRINNKVTVIILSLAYPQVSYGVSNPFFRGVTVTLYLSHVQYGG